VLQTEVHLIKQFDKVGASEATLLSMLKIFPFSYGLVVRQVYDNGTTYDPSILDITPDVLRAKFLEVGFLPVQSQKQVLLFSKMS
jgi:large subunit ribosomal protein LP0